MKQLRVWSPRSVGRRWKGCSPGLSRQEGPPDALQLQQLDGLRTREASSTTAGCHVSLLLTVPWGPIGKS